MTSCMAISHVSQALCHGAVHSLLVLVMSSCPCDSCHAHRSCWLLCCNRQQAQSGDCISGYAATNCPLQQYHMCLSSHGQII